MNGKITAENINEFQKAVLRYNRRLAIVATRGTGKAYMMKSTYVKECVCGVPGVALYAMPDGTMKCYFCAHRDPCERDENNPRILGGDQLYGMEVVDANGLTWDAVTVNLDTGVIVDPRGRGLRIPTPCFTRKKR